jgi:hypothetical protein
VPGWANLQVVAMLGNESTSILFGGSPGVFRNASDESADKET